LSKVARAGVTTFSVDALAYAGHIQSSRALLLLT
jgi:hypothetical protein